LDNPFLSFDEQAPAPLPQDASASDCGPWVRPADYRPLALMPAPAPDGPYGTSLTTFDGTSPNGEWKLYASDVGDGGDGYIGDRFRVDVHARLKATVEFADSAVTVPEGKTAAVTIKRSATGTLGPADVTVATTPGSASAGADFTPIAQTVHFDRGE